MRWERSYPRSIGIGDFLNFIAQKTVPKVREEQMRDVPKELRPILNVLQRCHDDGFSVTTSAIS